MFRKDFWLAVFLYHSFVKFTSSSVAWKRSMTMGKKYVLKGFLAGCFVYFFSHLFFVFCLIAPPLLHLHHQQPMGSVAFFGLVWLSFFFKILTCVSLPKSFSNLIKMKLTVICLISSI